MLVITQCSSNKVLPPSLELHKFINKSRSVESTIELWADALYNSNSEKLKAIEMYRGAWWNRIRSVINNSECRVNIVSAGYGFLNESTNICSYSASFSGGRDCIRNIQASGKNFSREWWDLLTTKKQLNTQGKISELSQVKRGEPIWIVLSKPYVYSVMNDLVRFLKYRQTKNTYILSFGKSVLPFEYQDFEIQFKMGWRFVLNSPLHILLVDIFKLIIDTFGDYPRKDIVFEWISDIEQSSKFSSEIPVRDKRSDDFISSWIKDTLNTQGKIGISNALRMYRLEGNASSVERFSRLYKLLDVEKTNNSLFG
ncbi:hypothetical protein K8I28_06105 [bacterium]|nr:hypothetical protein [bacterium]